MAYTFVTREPAMMAILSGGILRRVIDISFQRRSKILTAKNLEIIATWKQM